MSEAAANLAPAGQVSRPPGIVDRELCLGIAIIAIAILIPSLAGSIYWTYTVLLLGLYVTVAVLQNMLLGDAGQVSFGQGAVFGVAAYTCGIMAGMHGYGFATSLLFGIPAGILVGSLFALPALRVQGYYLGFVTLSAAVVFPELLVAFNDYTNGINGIRVNVPALNRPFFAGITPLCVIVFLLAAGALVLHAWLRRQRLGQRMVIAAASPEAAMTLGFSPGHVRSAAFVIAAVGTAMAGALYVPLVGFVSPSAFHVELSIFFFFSVIVGGQGRLIGPIAGVAVLYLLPNALLVDLVQYRLLGYGAVALLIMLLFPDGIVGTIAKRLGAGRPGAEFGELALAMPNSALATAARPGLAVDIADARKTYGKLAALDGVNLQVRAGSIHGLVGPNGSGKTTLLNAISGFIALDSGRIAALGRDTTSQAAWRTARLGIGRTFQTPRVFDALSIRENIEVAAAGPLQLPEAWTAAKPDQLPHAQRRLLEVLRVVASNAELLLLDEPAAGLSPAERRDFAQLLRTLRDRLGKTIVFVEHDLALVWRVADQITVLDAGRVIADGKPADIVAEKHVRALFTGAADA
ncbi:MAG: ATP-binding cassette domain-containing protein [Alphaproteobacteria bacterium]|nr:ATP-binding cassette domain-containing protein [Alphaproteobacteria bacterium]